MLVLTDDEVLEGVDVAVVGSPNVNPVDEEDEEDEVLAGVVTPNVKGGRAAKGVEVVVEVVVVGVVDPNLKKPLVESVAEVVLGVAIVVAVGVEVEEREMGAKMAGALSSFVVDWVVPNWKGREEDENDEEDEDDEERDAAGAGVEPKMNGVSF